ncbi:N-formylglutamate deformylase [Sphingomonas koreensis]|nr:N-formylglutamate deformylase [Sphingomonas koreensis]
MSDWLTVERGNAPLVLAFPHTGTDLPAEIEPRFVSAERARKDTDWWVDRLYAFAADLGATTVRTAISRSVIDVNRDPSGASLYPGQATTDLCPTTTFDGEPLYKAGDEPDGAEIEERKARWFMPYHDALAAEIARLHQVHGGVVLYDCHSIRSVIPRLFEGELPHFNIGTKDGTTCSPVLQARVEAACRSPSSFPGEGRGPVGKVEVVSGSANQVASSILDPGLRRGSTEGWTTVTNGRFKGGWTTRHYGDPARGVHAIQMELACRGYLDEPIGADPHPWPVPFDPVYARPMTDVLTQVLQACLQPL